MNFFIKQAILLPFMLTLALAVQGQKKNSIPESVKTSFQKSFPTATKVHWAKDCDGYEAEFLLDNIETSALFDSTGTLIETESEIPVSTLPKEISDYISQHYPGKKIKEASKIMNEHGVVMIEVELKGMEVFFDSQGKFIKESK